VREGRFAPDQNVLFVHTGGQLALFSAALNPPSTRPR